ncbi:ketoacyl-ACP synthase III family protein [Thalassomonas haliotis]|uniref:Ketoacyl-ACP synthase III family protein n=1 Tax=Thalassomonas haliotis TaxID=485448 RepID=A0ABY7VEW8_9GAMM|nr:ketoacyl-ACP synthase III family protein [Thalassomonas haliotis]WDE11561.1 ketoacyl-ACP synthase III family protein [Thalassomonas haliotis]
MYISGLGRYLPDERMTVAAAVSDDLYDSELAIADGYESAAIENELFPADMGLSAASEAMEEGGISGEDLSLLTYASIHRHGHARFWAPASYLQKELSGEHALPLTIQQGCNGAMIALKLAEKTLSCDAENKNALIVAADRFAASGFDRWMGDYGLIYGDAAVAAVISPTAGFAKILHSTVISVPELEALHRMDQASPEGINSSKDEYDIRATKKLFLQNHSRDGFLGPIQKALLSLRSGLLEDYDLLREPADWLIPPYVGSRIRNESYDKYFGDLAHKNGWQFGRTVGHLGASDALIGLYNLRQKGLLSRGQRVLMLSAGVGFSCSVVLLQVM